VPPLVACRTAVEDAIVQFGVLFVDTAVAPELDPSTWSRVEFGREYGREYAREHEREYGREYEGEHEMA
jgi:hypothetical protein